MIEQWQLYDKQGRALAGQGASKDDVFSKGLLHGASHVWMWRTGEDGTEVLLQKRAANKRTWPNRYDISAAGHIDLGEEPVTAALRETIEEIGLQVSEKDLTFIGVQRAYMVAEDNAIENEYQWLYLLQLSADTDFQLQASEVAALEWKPILEFKKEIEANPADYVPHGTLYYDTVIAAIIREAQQ